MSNGANLITEERTRQIESLGYDFNNDKNYENNELLFAALCYATPFDERIMNHKGIPVDWPWADKYWKPTPSDRNRELIKAGALIAAQIDFNLSTK